MAQAGQALVIGGGAAVDPAGLLVRSVGQMGRIGSRSQVAGRVTRGFSAMRLGFNRLCVPARGAGAIGGSGAEHGGPCSRALCPNSALERTAAAACAALLRSVSRPPRPLNSHVSQECLV